MQDEQKRLADELRRQVEEAAATAAGGALASPSTSAKMTFIKQAYTNVDLPEGGAASASGAWSAH